MERQAKICATALLFSIGSCTIPTAPEGSARFYPVKNSMFWNQYEFVRACVGKKFNHKSFWLIRWYEVPGDSIQTRHGKWVAAFGRGNAVYMARKYMATDFVIGHEIAHQVTDIGNSHDDPPFRKCGLMPDQNLIQGNMVVLDEDVEEFEEK